MARFRVLRGSHAEGGRMYGQGDVVDSKSDLLKHNSRGSIKFEKVDAIGLRPQGENPSPVSDDGLEDLTVSDLKSLAAEEEVELGQATRKDEIIDAIRAASVTKVA